VNPRTHLGDLEAVVLAAVARLRDATGTDLYGEVVERGGRESSLPAIHVTLRRLEDKGLLASETGDVSPGGGRPRRYYRLTTAGAEALIEFREMWLRIWSGLRIPDPEGLQ
jgi:DNA-binding PadR family transcriptional regulator